MGVLYGQSDTLTFKVKGLVCSFCAHGLNKGIGKLPFTSEDGVLVDIKNQAVKVALNEDFDAMILDIKMPGKHGIEVLEKIRENHKDLPVIVCTAYKHMKEDVEITGGKNTYFLAKPIELDELEKFLAEIS